MIIPKSRHKFSDSTPPIAFFYVTDSTYLLITLISAMQVREQVDNTDADILIVLTGLCDKMVEIIKAFSSPLGIIVFTMPPELYRDFDHSKFRKTYISHSALGRFFMLEFSPRCYENIIYLDGDTWICDSLTPLLKYRPPVGMIAAAEDPQFFYASDNSPTGINVRNYFESIGVSRERGYFNSGVIISSSETWRSVSRDAFEYFVKNTELCRFHDQSALNACTRDRRIRLSPRWNFVTKYEEWGVASHISPTIRHFAGPLKPWLGPIFPFSSFYYAYKNKFRDLRSLKIDPGHYSSIYSLLGSIKYFVKILALNSILQKKKNSKKDQLIRINDLSEF